MVDAIDTTVSAQARSLGGSRQVRTGVELAVTPVREPIGPISSTSETLQVQVLTSGDAPAAGQEPDQNAPPTRAVTPLVGDSALTTYHDQDSGRLVIRVFDRESGDVLMEFPPEGARAIPRSVIPATTFKPLTEVDV
jgi:hypothetical protein